MVVMYFHCALNFKMSCLFSLGRVHSGMNVVKRIGLVETDKNDRPLDDVKITRGYIRSH